MTSIYRQMWCAGAAGALLLAQGQQMANAQEAASAEPSQGSQIQEVIVTAQRRSENLQSVPVTVSAFSADTLADNNVISALDVGKLDASTIVQSTDGNVLLFIRGVGTPLVTMGNEASIAVYLDGNYQTRLNPALLLLNNVERIEILKGPQGTLFGRNASGGLMNIITADPKPGDPTSAKASVGYGNFDTIYGAANLSTSVGENFAFNLSAVYNNQVNGWGTNIATGGEAWSGLQEAIRGKGTLLLGDETRIHFAAYFARMKTDQGQQLQVLGQTQGWPTGSGLTTPVPPLPFFDTRNDLSNEFVTEDTGFSASIEHDFSFATLIDTATFNRTEENRPLDVDTTNLDAYNADFQDYTKEITNELRLVSNHTTGYQWTAGLYYYHTEQSYDPLALDGFSLGIPAGAHVQILSDMTVSSYAAYAQGTYEIARATNLTLGVRYTEDRDDGSGSQRLAIPGSDPVILATSSGDATFAQWSWRVALDHHFSDDVMAYVSANRGFKSGTFNLVPFAHDPVQPEVLTAYEIGLKNDLWQKRLRLNASVFYYDYKDAQVNTVPAPGILDIQNAPKSEVYGLDLDAQIRPMDRLSLNAGISLLHATYTDFPDAAFYEPGPAPSYGLVGPTSQSANGNYLSRAPKVAFNLGAQYTMPLANEAALNFSTHYSHVGDFYWDADNRVVQKAYGLLDAQIAYMFPGNHLKLRLWGSNLTNANYYANEFESAGPQGSVGAPAAPRTYGVVLDWML
jgi:iron complex outermembrane receptor protein